MDRLRTHIVIDQAKCVPCSGLICVGSCPRGILERGKSEKIRVIDEGSCTLCGVCVSLCPAKAIAAKTAKRTER